MFKKSGLIVATSALFMVVCACSLINLSPTSSDIETTVGINSPLSGQTLAQGPVDIFFYAGSSVGISKVELSINGAVVQNVLIHDAQNINVLQYQWTPVEAGIYQISVRAQNARGFWSESEAVTVTVSNQISPTLEPTATFIPTPTWLPTTPYSPTATYAPPPTATPSPLRIYDVNTNIFTFYYGESSCGANEIVITARVTQPEVVKSLLLFTRFDDHESTQISEWDSGRTMQKFSDGSYKVTLKASELANYNKFEFATLFYQIVATDTNNNSISRTTVFKDAHLEICPQSGTPAEVRFKNYTHNVDTFYYGAPSCGTNAITINTDVTHTENVAYVIVFVRFKDQTSDQMTAWDTGYTMQKLDEDSYRITLQSQNLDQYDTYNFETMSYQFVTLDKDKKISGRSLVFDDIHLERCWSK